MAAAEQLRLEIGSAYPLAQEMVTEVRGVDTASNLPRKAVITSEEVRESLTDPLRSIVDAVRQTIDDTPIELAADLADNGMVLCGGGALVRSMDRFLSEQTGVPTRLDSEPLTAAARGTLKCMEHLERWRAVVESSEA
jgi:rod shape-determining protein MreB